MYLMLLWQARRFESNTNDLRVLTRLHNLSIYVRGEIHVCRLNAHMSWRREGDLVHAEQHETR